VGIGTVFFDRDCTCKAFVKTEIPLLKIWNNFFFKHTEEKVSCEKRCKTTHKDTEIPKELLS
jgi:hypothetical protein